MDGCGGLEINLGQGGVLEILAQAVIQSGMIVEHLLHVLAVDDFDGLEDLHRVIGGIATGEQDHPPALVGGDGVPGLGVGSSGEIAGGFGSSTGAGGVEAALPKGISEGGKSFEVKFIRVLARPGGKPISKLFAAYVDANLTGLGIEPARAAHRWQFAQPIAECIFGMGAEKKSMNICWAKGLAANVLIQGVDGAGSSDGDLVWARGLGSREGGCGAAKEEDGQCSGPHVLTIVGRKLLKC